MRLALISDIHANLPALEAVLAAIALERVDQIVCLGDLVGYNAEPQGCLALLRAQPNLVVVGGNHDYDIPREINSIGTNKHALLAQAWTRQLLTADELDYLDQLPNKHIQPDQFIAVHGCYLNDWHYTGYVTGTMLEKNLLALANNDRVPSVGFCGHTHVPLAGYLNGGDVVEINQRHSAFSWPAAVRAVLINPGSVGQPRDNEPSAAYALIDLVAHQAEFRRVPYDIERAIAAIQRVGLPEELAERLRVGR